MELNDLDTLYGAYHRLINNVNCDFVRYLYDNINWNARIIGIKGPKGVGKTTMLLQHIRLTYKNVDEALYVSMDDIWFYNHSLMDLIDLLYNHGIYNIFIDEVHHCPLWATIFKNIYDQYPKMKIVYTGSSLLEIDHSEADLSRRQTVYDLTGLSFREYLAIEGIYSGEAINLEEIFSNHVNIAMQLTKEFKPLAEFEKYLKCGYYPFYKENIEDFYARLKSVVSTVIDVDVVATGMFEYKTIGKIKSLLAIVSSMVPFVPNMKVLFQQIETDRNLGLKMLYTLDKAKLLNLITTERKNYKNLLKPEKILLGDTNLMYALSPKVDIGTVRETFFANQISKKHVVTSPDKGDYVLDAKYVIEVGGKGKTFDQIKDIENSYLALDGIEIGIGHKIPLWLFGFLY